MISRKKPNSIQKDRKAHFKEFLEDGLKQVNAYVVQEPDTPLFKDILALFTQQKYGLIHSFRTRNESIQEYYEIFFDMFFDEWINQEFFEVQIALFFVLFIFIDTVPKVFQVKVLVCQEKVKFLHLLIE